ncbi:hypothetical protein DFP72DRAFT_884047 [Ephemerocybe angulata]|uniref:Arrestin-like N-terminal domain-containing protein n=1 Tax=Ephemerocybe angulata TaxID=980116 RepID=A0A8H6I8H4_9AGAR|nr:hypothetical protein DFP72DRAFT_884047 [Tulosesus angulatus]
MASAQPMAIPEPMNASPHHSKVKVSITLADRMFVAGGFIAGKVEMECRADKGLGIGVIMVELFANQELTSRDHSATSTFIHSKRIFQGPGLPPSNAVQAYPQPGSPVLPPHYHQARRGLSTFLFRIPIPEGSPCALTFGSGLAKVRYELRASVGVVWKEERKLVVHNQSVDVVAGWPYEELVGGKEPEGVVIGEMGKFWVHGKLVGPVVVAGESACVELHVKNHSNKKNTGLSLSLNRTLILPGVSKPGKQALELTDTLTHVPFRGPEYIIPPGAEGVANLVFDVPKHSRGVRGGTLEGDEEDPPRHTESLFEIRCTVDIKMSMGFGNKDLFLSVPVSIVHPKVVPPPQQAAPPVSSPYSYDTPALPYHYPASPVYPPLPMSPPPPPPFAVDHQHNQVWIPPPMSPQPYYSLDPYHHPQAQAHAQVHAYMAVPPVAPYLVRPSSAGGNMALPDPYTLPLPVAQNSNVSGLPPPSTHHISQMQPSHPNQNQGALLPVGGRDITAEEGKGQRALRVSHHLRVSSRTRSVSPQSHRFPILPVSPKAVGQAGASAAGTPVRLRSLPQPPGQVPGQAVAAAALVPAPAPVSPSTSLSPVVPARAGAMVYSPRPQLTPKTSFSHDSARPKSERVEELERMATVIALQKEDLSGDIPKDEFVLDAGLAALGPEGENDDGKKTPKDDDGSAEGKNKTLPAPPVPTRNKPEASAAAPTLSPSEQQSKRPRIDTLFDAPPGNGESNKEKESGLATPHFPSVKRDRTPPTPALTAVLPTRYPRAKLNNFLGVDNSESGLDALERKLLAQVGTRKFDEGGAKQKKDERPDVRDLMGAEDILSASISREGKGVRGVAPIDIPAKAQVPEPLNDESAISSLTLGNNIDGVLDGGDVDEPPVHAGISSGVITQERYGGGLGVGGNDSDFETKTHRGGSISGDERPSWNPPSFPLLMEDEAKWSSAKATLAASRHRREEAHVQTTDTAFHGSTPTKLSDGSRKSGKSRDNKERRSGKKGKERGEKGERAKTRTDAKGRVAAWLGGIDPEQPPEEEVIPASPSVARHPERLLGSHKGEDDVPPPPTLRAKTPSTEADKIHEEKDVSTAPNPRSSGFMPVGTARKDTTQRHHVGRDITVVEESRKITDLWATELSAPRAQEKPIPSPKEAALAKMPVPIPTRPTPQSVRTDHRVSPPSRDGIASDTRPAVVTPLPQPLRRPSPISGSRNVWQLPDPVLTVKSKEPPPVPEKTPIARSFALSPNKPSDPEVKYDVRSARGGRGGKVASVTAMWASVASGISTSQSNGSATTSKPDAKVMPRQLNHNGRFAPSASSNPSQPSTKSGPHLPGKIALPGLVASTSMGNGKVKTPTSGSVPVLPPRQDPAKPKVSSTNESGPVARKVDPAGVPKKLPARSFPITSSGSAGGKPTDLAVHSSSPAPGLFVGDFKSRTPGGKTTPSTNRSTPSSGETAFPKDLMSNSTPANKVNVKANGGGLGGRGGIASAGQPPIAAKRPVIKATSVPAMISSSHATPVLSSTASLARPAGASPAPRLTTGLRASASATSLLSKDKDKPKVDSSSVSVNAGGVVGKRTTLAPAKLVMDNLPSPAASGMASPTKSPPPDLAFGQARLRDLIRKYQTQAS